MIFSILAYKRKKIFTIYYLLFTIFIGLALSAFYWLPALLEMQYTNVLSQIGGAADFRNHFVCVSQLWESQWGFGGSAHSCIDGMSYRIGKLYVVLSFFSALLFFVTLAIRKNIKRYSLFLFSIGGLVISIFLTLGISMPVWETLPLMEFFQYPWRFLLLSSFFTSLIVGAIPFFLHTIIRNKQFFQMVQYICAFVFLFFLLYFNIKLFQPQTIMRKTVADYTNKIALVWTASKISDEYMPKNFQKPKNMNEVANYPIILKEKNTSIIKEDIFSNRMNFVLEGKEKSNLLLNIAYFPSWKIYIDDKETPFIINSKGISIVFPQGVHTLSARFVETPIEKLANVLTLIGIGILITGIIAFKKKKMYS
ncbi:MAG: hypothetical protein HYT06_00955 [Candidatus Levybacteria bacterium]|nr:hypothetical protein [Candidatus Levybacteria bacterium]